MLSLIFKYLLLKFLCKVLKKRVMKFHLIIFLSKETDIYIYKKKSLTTQLETIGLFHSHICLNGVIEVCWRWWTRKHPVIQKLCLNTDKASCSNKALGGSQAYGPLPLRLKSMSRRWEATSRRAEDAAVLISTQPFLPLWLQKVLVDATHCSPWVCFPGFLLF